MKSGTGRLLAVAAVAAVAALLVMLFAGGSNPYTVTARFENASQVVGGEIVTIAGEQVGTVEEIELAANGEALITFNVADPYAPLPGGTTATVRSFSLAGVANRQIELELPPPSQYGEPIADGAEMPQSDTVAEVDLDAVFNTLDDETVADLKNVVRGFERSYEGVAPQARKGLEYLNPLLYSSRRVIGELTSAEAQLERAIVETARLSGTLAERAPEISSLIGNANAAFGALGRQRTALGESVERLPSFMRTFNTTAVNLRAALDDLDPLVDASKPVAQELGPFFAEFRTASSRLVPAVNDLDGIVRRKGKQNDLVELSRSLVPLANIAIGPVERNGEVRAGALPGSARALRESLPILSYFRPYTPELLGWMDDFGHSGITDANGGLGRIAAAANSYVAATPGFPQIFDAPLTAGEQFDALDVGNTRRCPGGNERDPGDGSLPFTDDGAIDCTPEDGALGP